MAAGTYFSRKRKNRWRSISGLVCMCWYLVLSMSSQFVVYPWILTNLAMCFRCIKLYVHINIFLFAKNKILPPRQMITFLARCLPTHMHPHQSLSLGVCVLPQGAVSRPRGTLQRAPSISFSKQFIYPSFREESEIPVTFTAVCHSRLSLSLSLPSIWLHYVILSLNHHIYLCERPVAFIWTRIRKEQGADIPNPPAAAGLFASLWSGHTLLGGAWQAHHPLDRGCCPSPLGTTGKSLVLVSWVRKHLMSHWVHLKPFLHYNYYSSSLGRPTREEGLASVGVCLPSQLCPAGRHFPTPGAAIHARDHFIYGDWPKEKIPWKQNDLPFYLIVWYHL